MTLTAPPVHPAARVRGGLTLRVARREQEAADVVQLWLETLDGQPVPAWDPGAHLDLVLCPDLVRQYSLCGDPADRSALRIAVQLAPDGGRGGSRAVFDTLRPGVRVEVRGPRNAFALRPSPRYLFLAGGIGITPILPMLDRAAASGAQWQLVYGGRSRSGMPFLDRLAAHGDRVRVLPQDETGLLPLTELLAEPRPDTLVYCCGPLPLLEAVQAAMQEWPDGCLVFERFTPAPAAPGAATGPAGDGGFEVELAGSGRVVPVGPGISVLQALEEAGVPVLSSCREGTCGTCEVGVVSGEVDHRDRLLTPQERAAGETMMVCVSRCLGPRLVLDL
ncbi:MAG TPA: PDR/VanB family oxidoreductase [Kineosporiaceae bacterium]|nr:PDR/VanB family oxidoreductase [Kineosporiaceae bacterium]